VYVEDKHCLTTGTGPCLHVHHYRQDRSVTAVTHSALFVSPALVHKELNYCQLEGLGWLESAGEQSMKFSFAYPY